MNSLILKKLQETEFEILEEVVRICEENDLDYFLIGGTLLGAIRHKGFIPWDDDLDIAMPRKDYEKFLSLCKTQLKEQYFLHCIHTDSNYWLPFAKVRKNNTLFNEQSIIDVESHKGIFIDIFPLDNANQQCSIVQNIQSKLTKNISPIILNKRGIKVGKSNWRIKLSLIFMKPISIKFLSKLQQKLMSINSNDNAKYFINLGSNYNYVKQTIEKDKYYPSTKVEFEGKLFNAPNDWDYILTRIYGDYMQVPPKEKRVTHTPMKIEFGDE